MTSPNGTGAGLEGNSGLAAAVPGSVLLTAAVLVSHIRRDQAGTLTRRPRNAQA